MMFNVFDRLKAHLQKTKIQPARGDWFTIK